jgi:hypothetical protein
MPENEVLPEGDSTPVGADVEVDPKATVPAKPAPAPEPVPDQTEQQIANLKKKYDRQISKLREERLAKEQELENFRLQQAQTAPPEQRMSYLQDYYSRQLGATERERDILKAAHENDIPLDELEDVESPQQLQALVELKLKERELAAKIKEERDKMTAEVEKQREEIMREAVQKAKDELLQELGLRLAVLMAKSQKSTRKSPRLRVRVTPVN